MIHGKTNAQDNTKCNILNFKSRKPQEEFSDL